MTGDGRALDDLMARLRAHGAVDLTEVDVATLEAAAPGHVLAAKLLAAHLFNSGDYDAALVHARRAAELEPGPEAASNLVSVLARAGRVAEAIGFAEAAADTLDDLVRSTHLSELHARAGNAKEAREWGLKALALKDAEAGEPPERAAPVRHRFDPARPERNIIAFSLFGDNPRYLDGALRNAIAAPYVYPGWTARFYVDDRVPKATLTALSREGAQLRKVAGLPVARFGLYWRFLVEDDPEVDLYICRDADAVVNLRERMAVHQWLDSGQPFHVMRDHVSHSELVLAGLWGAHRGNIGTMSRRILDFDAGRRGTLNSRVDDQLFLRRVVWPLMRGRLCCHDAAFGFAATHSLPPEFARPPGRHVGQDERARRRPKAPR